jgi:hypothetical protein
MICGMPPEVEVEVEAEARSPKGKRVDNLDNYMNLYDNISTRDFSEKLIRAAG